MANGMNTRDPSSAEKTKWDRFVSYYMNTLTPTLLKTQFAAELCFWAQGELDRSGIDYIIWRNGDTEDIKARLARYNKIGRIISGVQIGKYRLFFKGDDFDVLTQIGAEQESYIDDQYQGLGAIPLIAIVIGGAVLIASAWAVVRGMDASAKKAETEYRNRLLTLDREMTKAGGETARLWNESKKASAHLIKEASKQAGNVGWIEKIFGSGASSAIGGLVIGALVIGGLMTLSKVKGSKK